MGRGSAPRNRGTPGAGDSCPAGVRRGGWVVRRGWRRRNRRRAPPDGPVRNQAQRGRHARHLDRRRRGLPEFPVRLDQRGRREGEGDARGALMRHRRVGEVRPAQRPQEDRETREPGEVVHHDDIEGRIVDAGIGRDPEGAAEMRAVRRDREETPPHRCAVHADREPFVAEELRERGRHIARCAREGPEAFRGGVAGDIEPHPRDVEEPDIVDAPHVDAAFGHAPVGEAFREGPRVARGCAEVLREVVPRASGEDGKARRAPCARERDGAVGPGAVTPGDHESLDAVGDRFRDQSRLVARVTGGADIRETTPGERGTDADDRPGAASGTGRGIVEEADGLSAHPPAGAARTGGCRRAGSS